jgi:hypothetical protein
LTNFLWKFFLFRQNLEKNFGGSTTIFLWKYDKIFVVKHFFPKNRRGRGKGAVVISHRIVKLGEPTEMMKLTLLKVTLKN